MKAIVLAGGYATRLWPITRHRPKMFLPIGEETVIDRIFRELEAEKRISEVFVSTNERFADDFRDHLAASPYEKLHLSVEGTREEDEKFGVIGALGELIEREGIDDDVLVIAGDNLISFEVGEFIDFYETNAAPCIAAYDVGSIDRAQSYGVVELDGERLVGFEEKPERPSSTLVSIACYAFPQASLSRLPAYLAAGENPDEPGWFIKWLYRQTDVYAFSFDQAWFDIGTPESYLDAVRWCLDGEAIVHPDATVERTTVGENVHVMEGATVTDCNLESSVIFGGSTLRNCDIRRCIIDRNTEIDGIDLNGALIGAHTQISNGS